MNFVKCINSIFRSPFFLFNTIPLIFPWLYRIFISSILAAGIPYLFAYAMLVCFYMACELVTAPWSRFISSNGKNIRLWLKVGNTLILRCALCHKLPCPNLGQAYYSSQFLQITSRFTDSMYQICTKSGFSDAEKADFTGF